MAGFYRYPSLMRIASAARLTRANAETIQDCAGRWSLYHPQISVSHRAAPPLRPDRWRCPSGVILFLATFHPRWLSSARVDTSLGSTARSKVRAATYIPTRPLAWWSVGSISRTTLHFPCSPPGTRGARRRGPTRSSAPRSDQRGRRGADRSATFSTRRETSRRQSPVA
uniref:Uncharacterized protein n=1 Tax=uncultured marine virus TaxID=186617 RepID=A0A0F7L247_9VIRU|nr:hypothetical protein Adeh_1793 [uncultured marine virus]